MYRRNALHNHNAIVLAYRPPQTTARFQQTFFSFMTIFYFFFLSPSICWPFFVSLPHTACAQHRERLDTFDDVTRALQVQYQCGCVELFQWCPSLRAFVVQRGPKETLLHLPLWRQGAVWKLLQMKQIKVQDSALSRLTWQSCRYPVSQSSGGIWDLSHWLCLWRGCRFECFLNFWFLKQLWPFCSDLSH